MLKSVCRIGVMGAIGWVATVSLGGDAVVAQGSLMSQGSLIAQGSVWPVETWFSPQQPVKLRIVNRTPYPLEYGLTDPRPIVTEVQAGEQVELTTVRIPNCLAINTPMMSPVQYDATTVSGNWIVVEVTVVSDVSGDHCLDLRESGAVYIY